VSVDWENQTDLFRDDFHPPAACQDDIFDFAALDERALLVLEDPFERASWTPAQLRRWHRLATHVYGALTATHSPENPPSVHNCECSPTPGGPAATAADATDAENGGVACGGLDEAQRELLPIVFQLGVDDVERAAEVVENPCAAGPVLYRALERESRERQQTALALLRAGEHAHARKLVSCGQTSVQLQCGCCESDENYVPQTCDSPLCPDCRDRRTGQNIAKYRDAVRGMQSPVHLTLTMQNVADPAEGREQMVENLGKLRRKTIPFEGETVRETDDGETVRKSWSWWDGADVEDFADDHEQWKVQLQAQGRHDLVRRLQREYVNYEWEDATGTHVGRNIPFDELHDGGLYGIDIKQQEPLQYHVHAHVVIDLAYTPQSALAAAWEEITGGACVVDVRSIYDRGERDDVAEALAETVGYATKPPEFESLEDEVEYVTAAKGSPTVHPFGSLHGNASAIDGLICASCELMPEEWRYVGTVDERRDTVGKTWETDRGKDPPE
jgi:hypothetical protein